jgi:hypothetical protein
LSWNLANASKVVRVPAISTSSSTPKKGTYSLPFLFLSLFSVFFLSSFLFFFFFFFLPFFILYVFALPDGGFPTQSNQPSRIPGDLASYAPPRRTWRSFPCHTLVPSHLMASRRPGGAISPPPALGILALPFDPLEVLPFTTTPLLKYKCQEQQDKCRYSSSGNTSGQSDFEHEI